MTSKSELLATRFGGSLRQTAALYKKNAEELGQMAAKAKKTGKPVNNYSAAQLRAMAGTTLLRYEWTEMLAHNEELKESRADRDENSLKYFEAHGNHIRALLAALDSPRVAEPFTMKLASVGNPDFGQYHGENEASPTITLGSESLATLVAVQEAYIAVYELGGGNMARGSGDVYKGGALVARISYNGRVWTPEDFPKCREIDPATGNVMASAS